MGAEVHGIRTAFPLYLNKEIRSPAECLNGGRYLEYCMG
jgi:hypothetical protein